MKVTYPKVENNRRDWLNCIRYILEFTRSRMSHAVKYFMTIFTWVFSLVCFSFISSTGWWWNGHQGHGQPRDDPFYPPWQHLWTQSSLVLNKLFMSRLCLVKIKHNFKLNRLLVSKHKNYSKCIWMKKLKLIPFCFLLGRGFIRRQSMAFPRDSFPRKLHKRRTKTSLQPW